MGSERRRQKKLQKKAAKREEKRRESRAREMPTDMRGWIRRSSAWPVKEAWVGWDSERTLATIIVARETREGTIAAGAFLVDVGCLGVKSAFARPFSSEDKYREFVRKMGQPVDMRRSDPAYALKIIETGLAYARDLGFTPDPDYRWSKHVLEGIDSSTCREEIVCGKDGKPYYVNGPDDNTALIMHQLRERLGPGGFDCVIHLTPDVAEDMGVDLEEVEEEKT